MAHLLFFLIKIFQKIRNLRQKLKIKLFFIEINKDNFYSLKENIERFIDENLQIINKIEIEYFNNDCNEVIGDILSKIINDAKYPIFVFIDPTGLQVKNIYCILGNYISILGSSKIVAKKQFNN